MPNQFNLQDLFQAVWGYRPPLYKITDPDGSKNIIATGSPDFKFKDENIVNKKSQGNYGEYYKKDLQGRQIFMPITIGGYFIPYAWAAISGSKKIVETAMTERRGSVNEIIGMNDYQISIKGFLIGQDGHFPEDFMDDMRALFEKLESVELQCILTDIFLLSKEHGGQAKVIITSLDIKEAQGIENVRGFEMSLKTDQIFELEIV
jgi:hypothetical protein